MLIYIDNDILIILYCLLLLNKKRIKMVFEIWLWEIKIIQMLLQVKWYVEQFMFNY